MRTLVYMSDNRPISTDFLNADYNSLAAVINYQYCLKHGYNFVYHQSYYKVKEPLSLQTCVDSAGLKRHASWAKLLSGVDLAKSGNYDYIVYIDSDCIFKNHEKKIEDYILSEKNITFITNFMNGVANGVLLPNAGFFGFKVNQTSIDFIKGWFNYDLKESNLDGFWEQDALWLYMYGLPPKQEYLVEMYKLRVPNRAINENIGIIDDVIFIEKEGQMVLHICHIVSQHRKPYFSNFIIEKKFNYPLLAKKIIETHFKEFDCSL